MSSIFSHTQQHSDLIDLMQPKTTRRLFMATSVIPGSGNTQNPLPKLSRLQIFENLAAKTCKVIWKPATANGSNSIETSGCFIQKSGGPIRVLTCFHEAKWALLQIEIVYETRKYKGILAKDVLPNLALHYDLSIIDIDSKEKFPVFNISESPSYPISGEKIYFAGFPFGEDQVLVHKGTVSSSYEPHGYFTIDGTVVQGNSGGPIARVQDNQQDLELIGIINSQLVNLTEQLVYISHLKPAPFRPHNDPAPTYAGGTSVITVVNHLVKNLLSNISTGIGKAGFISLHLFIKNPLPKGKELSQIKKIPKAEAHSDLGDNDNDGFGAMDAYKSMQGPDLWMQRTQSQKTPSSTPDVSAPTRISHLPVVKGEDLPANATKFPKAWEWTHSIKTNKRTLFNKITERQNNNGEANSKGKDNVKDEEFERCIQFYELQEQIEACESNEHVAIIKFNINISILSAEVKALLNQQLNESHEQKEISSVENDIKIFLNKISRLKRKALNERKAELISEKEVLMEKVVKVIKDPQKQKKCIEDLSRCLDF